MTVAEMRKLVNLPNPIPRHTTSRQCNTMSYTDGNGLERQIWLPKGTMQRAWELLQQEKWDELANFEDWSEFAIVRGEKENLAD
jgi:hypothetical protein